MKLWKITFFALLLCFVAACEDDDEPPVCTQDTWLGTYTGTATCDGVSDPTTVTITASGPDQIVIRYAAGSTTTTFDPLPVTNCNLSRTNSSGGVTGSVTAELNGNSFELTETVTGGGFNINCTVSATRD